MRVSAHCTGRLGFARRIVFGGADARTPIFAVASCLSVLISAGSGAQTLDEQYQLYLRNDCAGLELDEDESGRLLPGQAGPRLASFCQGPIGPIPGGVGGDPLPGVTTSTSATGGAAGAAAARGSLLANDDAALQDRREASEDDPAGAIDAEEISLFRTGRAAGFVSLDRRFERQRESQFESGRRAYSLAATFGADYRIRTSAVAGVALSHTDMSGSFGGGGDFDSSGHGIWAYGAWMPGERAFLDASVSAERQDRSTRRLVGLRTITETPNATFITIDPPLALTDGDTRAREKIVQVGGGFDFFIGNTTIGPRAGWIARRTRVGAFVEDGATPMTLAFDAQTIDSRRSTIGVQASRAFGLQRGALVAQLNFDWLHEFRDDQRLITARFAEDLRPDATRLSFLNQAPDRDWFDLRIGAVAVFSNRFSAFLSLEGTLGHAYLDRYAASAGVRREF